MEESRARSINAYCTMISTSVTVLGVLAVILQISNYIDSKNTENRKKQEELIAKLYFADIDLNKLLMDHPQLQQIMYNDTDGSTFRSQTEVEKMKCYAACQMYGDLLEYYTMLENNLRSSDEDSRQMFYCWEQYVKYFWAHSFAFRQYIVLTRDTWTPRFLAKFPKDEFERIVKDVKDVKQNDQKPK